MRNATLMTTTLALMVGLGACTTLDGGRQRLVRAPPSCQDVTVSIYFEQNVAGLTPEGRRVIAAAARSARGCRVDSVRVLGLADAAGDPAANLELSRQRAAAVAAAIVKSGLPPAAFEVEAAGQAGSVTRAGEMRPVRRRADITLRLGKPD